VNATSLDPLLERQQLREFGRHPTAITLRPFYERYGALVFSSACRRTGDAAIAETVTAAVFLVFSRRARKLSKRTILAGWLFGITKLACRKYSRKQPKARRSWWPRLFRRPDEIASERLLGDELDGALDRLPTRERDAVLLKCFLQGEWPAVAASLRCSEKRARRRAERGWTNLLRILEQRGVKVEPAALANLFAAEGSAGLWKDGTSGELFASCAAALANAGRTSPVVVGRRVLWILAWKRWRRRVVFGVPLLFLSSFAALGTLYYLDSLSGHSRSIAALLVWSAKHEAKTVPGLAQPARVWPQDRNAPRLAAASVRSPLDIYQKTNIWLACLTFTPEQWRALEPEWIGPLPNFFQPDGTVLLRHPEAQRSGLAGVLGYDFHWTRAALEFGGRSFTNVAVRYKGNGTYLGSLYGDKRAFKVDLNKFAKGQVLGGTDELNFNNLVNDHSCMSDALAYEFFRDAGVPAPHTAYAYLSLTVSNHQHRKPLGLYVLVETVDKNFMEEWLGSPLAPLFKPVTYDLFRYLGNDWAAYEGIYDLKTKATAAQRQRLIQFARLLTSGTDSEFAEQLGGFLDIDAFARFLAGQVLLSNYDSLLSTGQNYYLYLDPASNKFGFIPWDLDLAWGGFFLLGSTRDRELASIWHPWVGENRFLERVMPVESFRTAYRVHLEDFLARLFTSSRLHARVHELAEVLRGPIGAESDFRRGKFEEALAERRLQQTGDYGSHNRPAHDIKRFIVNRARSVREQLDGTSEGVILERRGRR
jgi:DNA-directed RNA polymerase specialized sigma24 family protein